MNLLKLRQMVLTILCDRRTHRRCHHHLAFRMNPRSGWIHAHFARFDPVAIALMSVSRLHSLNMTGWFGGRSIIMGSAYCVWKKWHLRAPRCDIRLLYAATSGSFGMEKFH